MQHAGRKPQQAITFAAWEREQEAEDVVAGIKRKYEVRRDHCSSMIHFIELTQRRVYALFDPSCAEMRAKLQTMAQCEISPDGSAWWIQSEHGDVETALAHIYNISDGPFQHAAPVLKDTCKWHVRSTTREVLTPPPHSCNSLTEESRQMDKLSNSLFRKVFDSAAFQL